MGVFSRNGKSRRTCQQNIRASHKKGSMARKKLPQKLNKRMNERFPCHVLFFMACSSTILLVVNEFLLHRARKTWIYARFPSGVVAIDQYTVHRRSSQPRKAHGLIPTRRSLQVRHNPANLASKAATYSKLDLLSSPWASSFFVHKFPTLVTFVPFSTHE